MTNGVTATTQSASDNSTKVATTAYTDTAIANLVDSAPGTLNTLNELAAALGDDANFSTPVTNSIATKLPLAGGTLTGDLTLSGTAPIINFTDSDNNPDYKLRANAGAFFITDATANSNRFVVNADGHVDVTGNLDVGSGVDVTGDITSTGNLTISNTAPRIVLNDTDTDSDFRILVASGNFRIQDVTNGNANRLFINSGGTVNIAGNLDVGAGIDVTGDSTFAGNLTVSGTVPHIDLNDTDNESDYRIRNVNGTFQILDIDQAGGTVFFQRETNTDVTVTGNFNVTNGVDVTGNITVTGTVDGRDVATDGTKLDGIESGATADQTASEILTLIKTVDGNGSGLDADLLDGVSQASFLRSDTTDTATGAITFTNSHLQLSGHHYQGYHSSAQNYIHF